MLLFIIHAGFALQSKSWTIYPGKPNNGKYSVRKLWLLIIEEQILKMTLPQNQHAFIKINNLGVILLEKNAIRNNAHNFSFCSSFSWNYCSKVLHSFWATLYWQDLFHKIWIAYRRLQWILLICISLNKMHILSVLYCCTDTLLIFLSLLFPIKRERNKL